MDQCDDMCIPMTRFASSLPLFPSSSSFPYRWVRTYTDVEGGGEGEGGYTALYMAVCGGHKGCVRALVEMGAKVDERSGRERLTPRRVRDMWKL